MSRWKEHQHINEYSSKLPEQCFLQYEPQYRHYRLSERGDDGKVRTLRTVPEKTVLMWQRRPEVFASIAKHERRKKAAEERKKA